MERGYFWLIIFFLVTVTGIFLISANYDIFGSDEINDITLYDTINNSLNETVNNTINETINEDDSLLLPPGNYSFDSPTCHTTISTYIRTYFNNETNLTENKTESVDATICYNETSVFCNSSNINNSILYKSDLIPKMTECSNYGCMGTNISSPTEKTEGMFSCWSNNETALMWSASIFLFDNNLNPISDNIYNVYFNPYNYTELENKIAEMKDVIKDMDYVIKNINFSGTGNVTYNNITQNNYNVTNAVNNLYNVTNINITNITSIENITNINYTTINITNINETIYNITNINMTNITSIENITNINYTTNNITNVNNYLGIVNQYS